MFEEMISWAFYYGPTEAKFNKSEIILPHSWPPTRTVNGPIDEQNTKEILENER
jgi:hypothetical protein